MNKNKLSSRVGVIFFLILVIFLDFSLASPYLSVVFLVLLFTVVDLQSKLATKSVAMIYLTLLLLIYQTILYFENTAFLIDLKYYLNIIAVFILFSFLSLKDNFKENLLSATRIVVVLVFSYYLFFFIVGGNGVSVYRPEFIPSFISHRVFGPSLMLLCLLSLIDKDNSLKLLALLFLSSLIKGAGQEFVISVLSLFILAYRYSKVFSVLFIILPCLIIGVLIVLSKPEVLYIKFLSFQTRISDLKFVLRGFDINSFEAWFGAGIGVKSEVIRYNPFTKGVSEVRDFLEIDNGYYYIFHRFGFIGLSVLTLMILRAFFLKNNFLMAIFLSVTVFLSITFITSISTFLFFLLVISNGYFCENKLLNSTKA